jgi:hypothetical protein
METTVVTDFIRGNQQITQPTLNSYSSGFSNGTESAYDEDELAFELSFDRPKVIRGSFLGNGYGATGHEHSIYDADFVGREQRPTLITAKDYRYIGPETVARGRMAAEQATREIVQWHQPVWHTTLPDHRSKLDYYAKTINQEMAAMRDRVNVRHVEYDKMGRALDTQDLIQAQKRTSGPFGAFVKNVTSFLMNPFTSTNSHRRAHGAKGRPQLARAYPFVPELAMALLLRPPQSLLNFYARDPECSLIAKETLARISQHSADISPRDEKRLSALVGHILCHPGIDRDYDPLMREYMEAIEPHVSLPGIPRMTAERIRRIVIGHYGNNVPSVATLIRPLTLHMYQRQIPINIENVLAEMDAMFMTRNSAIVLAMKSVGNYDVGMESAAMMGNMEISRTLANYDHNVQALITHSPPEQGEPMFYPSNEMPHEPRDVRPLTRDHAGRTPRGLTSGGYFIPGEQKITAALMPTSSSSQQFYTEEPPLYNPMHERRDLHWEQRTQW